MLFSLQLTAIQSWLKKDNSANCQLKYKDYNIRNNLDCMYLLFRPECALNRCVQYIQAEFHTLFPWSSSTLLLCKLGIRTTLNIFLVS